MDLVTRLLAAIEETERIANEEHRLPCASFDPCYEPPYEVGPDYALCDCKVRPVLRRCAADRKVIELHRGGHECPSGEGHPTFGYAWFGDDGAPWCTTLHLLADGYNIKVGEDD